MVFAQYNFALLQYAYYYTHLIYLPKYARNKVPLVSRSFTCFITVTALSKLVNHPL